MLQHMKRYWNANRLVDAARRYIKNPSLLYSRSNDPAFIIIGAQKSGTSSLFHWLNQHPKMRGSVIKEVHYFNTKIHFGMDIGAYRRYFCGKSDFHFEATPAYLYHPGSCENMHHAYPNIKLVVVLRDPVERAYSAYNHYRTQFPIWHKNVAIIKKYRRDGNILDRSFFEGRDEFPSFRECIDIEMQLIDKPEYFEPALLRRGLYLPQLQHYLRYYDRSQILILGFKDLVDNTVKTLDSICYFLNVNTIDWNNVRKEPQNQRIYHEKVSDIDRAFLQDFYKKPNEKLFDAFGPLNW
jgi:hypothetical protein